MKILRNCIDTNAKTIQKISNLLTFSTQIQRKRSYTTVCTNAATDLLSCHSKKTLVRNQPNSAEASAGLLHEKRSTAIPIKEILWRGVGVIDQILFIGSSQDFEALGVK